MEKEPSTPKATASARDSTAGGMRPSPLQEGYGRTLAASCMHRPLVLVCSAWCWPSRPSWPSWWASISSRWSTPGRSSALPGADRETRLEIRAAGGAPEQRIQDIVPVDELETSPNMGWDLVQPRVRPDRQHRSQDADILIALKPKHAPPISYMERIRRELPDDFRSTMYFSGGHRLPGAQLRPQRSHRRTDRWASTWKASYAVAPRAAGQIRRFPAPTDVASAQVLGLSGVPSTVAGRTLPRSGYRAATWRSNLLVSLRLQLAGRGPRSGSIKNNVDYPWWYSSDWPRRFDRLALGDAARPQGRR